MTQDEEIKSRIIEDALNSVGTDIDGNISALSLADYIYGRIQNSFQSRVKALEEESHKFHNEAEHFAKLATVDLGANPPVFWKDVAAKLQRKLEVARSHAIYQDCGRLCDSDPNLNYREQYERSTTFVDKLIDQALAQTETEG